MIDQKKIFVMPFRYVVSGNGAMEESQYFAKDGSPFYSMIEPTRDSSPEDDVEFNSDIYCKLISITDSEEAAAFFAEYPTIRFAFKEENTNFVFPVDEYETIDSYYRVMTRSISLYILIREFMILEYEYRRISESDLRNRALVLFRDLYSTIGYHSKAHAPLNSFHTLFMDEYGDLMEAMCSSDAVTVLANEKGYHSVEDALCNNAISYRDVIVAYFDGNEDAAQEQLAHLEDVYDKVFDLAIRDVSNYCRSITQRIDMSFATDLNMFVCRCPDLLSAMYLMTYVALHNGDEYKKCQHKNCHQYYLVNSDPRYAQTRCPKHMKPRQKKRKNQAAKMKNSEY